MIKLTTAKQGLRLPPPNVSFKTLLKAVTVTATTLMSLGVLLPSSAQAISLVGRSDINSFGANDYYDWGTLGGNGTIINNPSTVTSNFGESATISQSGESFQILKQSLTPGTWSPGTGWRGNFHPGDNLLWTNESNGPITITFANPVFGALTQIQGNSSFGNFFTANLTAYDVSNNSLGTFSLAGLSTSNADNSAIFIGVKDSTASIAKLTFSVPDSNLPQDFSISRFYLNTNGGDVNTTPINSEIAAVPWETDALPVVTSAILFGLGLWLKRKYQKNKYSQDFNKEQVNNA
jgi:hypothetical protein